MVVSLKTDLRFPIPGQQGHGSRIIHLWKLDFEDEQDYEKVMNNPKDRIYNLQEFTELIANEIKENQKKLVDPNDEEALKRIDEQMEAFKRQMLGAAYNKVYQKDYLSNNYSWRADNAD